MNATATTVVIRKYGLLDPLDWGVDCDRQLQLQNKLWNRLVRIERDAQARYREIFKADRNYAQLVAGLESLDRDITSLRHSRRATGPANLDAAGEDVGAQIRTLLARRRELSQQEHAMRRALRPVFAPALLHADNERKAAAKHARQDSGLWWGNYNAVCSAYERARVRTFHTGAQLRFRAFDGTGRFRNQIVGGMGVADLFAGRHAQVRVATLASEAHTHPVRAERRRRSRTTLTATLYTLAGERRMLTWPMIMHRPIPADARIKEIVVTRKREGTRFRWSAIFICARTGNATPAPATASAAGVTLSSLTDDAGVRFATVFDSEGRLEHLRLPRTVVERAAYIETLQARLAARLSEIRERLSAWLADEEFPEAMDTLARAAERSRLPDPMTHLALAWREYPDFRPDWRDDMESWRRAEKRERTEMANLQRKMVGLRRQHYQCEAKRLSERYGAIALRSAELVAATRNVDADARRTQRLVALSEIVEWLHTQCAKTGTRIEQISNASAPVRTESADASENAAASALAWLLKHRAHT